MSGKIISKKGSNKIENEMSLEHTIRHRLSIGCFLVIYLFGTWTKNESDGSKTLAEKHLRVAGLRNNGPSQTDPIQLSKLCFGNCPT